MARKPRDPSWMPVVYDVPQIEAVKALALGEATGAQQTVALKWLIETACGTYDLSFRSDGDGGERETAFAEGRRFVGLQMVKLINLPPKVVAAMRDKNG